MLGPEFQIAVREFYANKSPPKTISDASMNRYHGDLVRMGKEITGSPETPKNLDFLLDPETVGKWLNDPSITGKVKGLGTVRNYYSSMLVGLQAFKYPDNLRMHYGEIRNKMNEDLKHGEADPRLTENQKKNMVQRAEILTAIDNLSVKVHRQPLPLINSKTDIADLQMLIILRLYERIPARNELAELKFLTMETYEAMKQQPSASMTGMGNFLVREITEQGPQYHISLNKYKTQKRGERSFSISKETPYGLSMTSYLNEIIVLNNNKSQTDEMLDFTPIFRSNWNTMRPLTAQDLTKKLGAFFMVSLGKKVSTTLLAKSLYEQEIGPELSKKLRELALARGHSVNTALAHYV